MSVIFFVSSTDRKVKSCIIMLISRCFLPYKKKSVPNVSSTHLLVIKTLEIVPYLIPNFFLMSFGIPSLWTRMFMVL